MSEQIIVPALGESITEATVAKWLKNVGDNIEADEPIVELETDKVNLEVKSVLPKGMPSIYIYDKNLGVAQGLLLQIRYTYSEPRINSKGKQLPGRHRLFADGGPLFKNLTRIVYNQKDK